MKSTVNSAAHGGSPMHALNPLALLIATLLLFSFVLVSPLAAQENVPTNFSEDELQAFAVATLEVEKVQAKWQPQLANAETAEENAAIRQQAIQEMTEVIQGEGLSVDQYNGMHAAVQQNPAVLEKVREYRQDLQ